MNRGMKRKKRVVIGVLVVVLAGVPLFGIVYHFRPLVRTNHYVATVHGEDGTEGSATVYTMLGRAGVLFVEMPESHRKPFGWFTIQTRSRLVAVPNGPDRDPYLRFNHDMSLGVSLGSSKMDDLDDHWTVDWSDERVVFSNGTLTVRVERHG